MHGAGLHMMLDAFVVRALRETGEMHHSNFPFLHLLDYAIFH
jgi:hypothetical protein